ncbi:hypothetical protein QYM36_007221, partial [Artemia franciscana]
RKQWRKCCINGCDLTARDDLPIRFHIFPSNNASSSKWVAAIQQLNNQVVVPSKNTLVCSAHFLSKDYPTGGRVLSKQAVPSLFNQQEVMVEAGSRSGNDSSTKSPSSVFEPSSMSAASSTVDSGKSISPSTSLTEEQQIDSSVTSYFNGDNGTTLPDHKTERQKTQRKQRGKREVKDVKDGQCEIEGCSNTKEVSNTHKTRRRATPFQLFPFPPKSSVYRAQWISATNKGGMWTPGPLSCVCSKHFIGNKPSSTCPVPILSVPNSSSSVPAPTGLSSVSSVSLVVSKKLNRPKVRKSSVNSNQRTCLTSSLEDQMSSSAGEGRVFEKASEKLSPVKQEERDDEYEAPAPKMANANNAKLDHQQQQLLTRPAQSGVFSFSVSSLNHNPLPVDAVQSDDDDPFISSFSRATVRKAPAPVLPRGDGDNAISSYFQAADHQAPSPVLSRVDDDKGISRYCRATDHRAPASVLTRDDDDNGTSSYFRTTCHQSRVPVLPKDDDDTAKGRFGWETVNDIPFPYIFRNGEKYTPVSLFEQKILMKFKFLLKPDIYSCVCIRSVFVTPNEAQFLCDINAKHCDFYYFKSQNPFTLKDLLVKVSDAKEFYSFLEVVHKKLILKSTDPSDKCGFYKINDDCVIPYIMKAGVKYVPQCYFETDNLKAKSEIISGWDLGYLKFCFKVEGLRNKLSANDQCAVVNMEDIKKYYSAGTEFVEYWPHQANISLNGYSDSVHAGMWTRMPSSHSGVKPNEPTKNTTAPRILASVQNNSVTSSASIRGQPWDKQPPRAIEGLQQRPRMLNKNGKNFYMAGRPNFINGWISGKAQRNAVLIQPNAYRVQKTVIDGKNIPAINLSPSVYSPDLVTFHDLTASGMVFHGMDIDACKKVFEDLNVKDIFEPNL